MRRPPPTARPLRAVLLLAGLLFWAGLAGGCQSLLAVLEGPTARVTGVSFGALALDSLTLNFDLEVANPYDVPLPLVNLDYGLASAGQPFVSGQADLAGSVPAKGTKAVQLPVRVNFVETLRLVSGLRPGQVVHYQASLGLSVDAPALGRLRLPLSREGRLPIPTLPRVELASVQIKSLAAARVEAVLSLRIGNRNEFPVDLGQGGLTLSLGGVPVGQVALRSDTKFEPGGEGSLSVPISFTPVNAGLGLAKALTGADTSYELAGDLEMGTPFGRLTAPFKTGGKATLR